MFDPTVEGVQNFLSQTPFAASKVDRLSGGSANFVYRITLQEPYAADSASAPVRTVVLKHAEPYVALNNNFSFAVERQDFETLAYRLVPRLISSSLIVDLPRLYHEDHENRALFISDSGEASTTLKTLLQTAPPTNKMSDILGHSLGTFLARLHTSTIPADSPGSEIKAAFASNQAGRFVSGYATYGRLIETLLPQGESRVDPPLDLPTVDLEKLAVLEKTMRDRIMTSDDVLTMGDFWSGNILLLFSPEPHVTVIDWELAKPGLAGLDIGQFLAECHLLRDFYPSSRPSVNHIISSFLTAYREVFLKEPGLKNTLEDAARVAAIHFGVHLCVWTPRTSWGSKEQTRAVVVEGVDYMLRASDGDKAWLKTSIVGELLS